MCGAASSEECVRVDITRCPPRHNEEQRDIARKGKYDGNRRHRGQWLESMLEVMRLAVARNSIGYTLAIECGRDDTSSIASTLACGEQTINFGVH